MPTPKKRILLVCSDYRENLETQLAGDGWIVVWANDSKTALAKVRRAWFDITVLISTGQEMDITETLLNLRDMRPAMPIVVVKREDGIADVSRSGSYPIPNTSITKLQDLKIQIRSLIESKPPQKLACR